jgi:hypothetical protein
MKRNISLKCHIALGVIHKHQHEVKTRIGLEWITPSTFAMKFWKIPANNAYTMARQGGAYLATLQDMGLIDVHFGLTREGESLVNNQWTRSFSFESRMYNKKLAQENRERRMRRNLEGSLVSIND